MLPQAFRGWAIALSPPSRSSLASPVLVPSPPLCKGRHFRQKMTEGLYSWKIKKNNPSCSLREPICLQIFSHLHKGAMGRGAFFVDPDASHRPPLGRVRPASLRAFSEMTQEMIYRRAFSGVSKCKPMHLNARRSNCSGYALGKEFDVRINGRCRNIPTSPIL